LSALSRHISKEGIIKALRSVFRYKHLRFDLYYVSTIEQNTNNIFSVTRQLKYSLNNENSTDFAIFINGLPIITCELKNNITGQNTQDAIEQYKRDRDSKELIFNFKRCVCHFALDEHTIAMCTKLDEKSSWFLPFNKGQNDGAGNPYNPNGLNTDYFWKYVLTKPILSKILENYAQVIEEKDRKTNKVKEKQIFPRYHQLDVVEYLIDDVGKNGVGKKYLIQHSAGSGKSNSISWLAYGLVKTKLFDTVLVVTDRVNLDKQIRDTIKAMMEVKGTVEHAFNSSELKKRISNGTPIVISTVHKFQEILKELQEDYGNKKFAIIIDEAHSSQNGSLAAKMNMVLSGNTGNHDKDIEEIVKTIIEGRKMVENASYFAFTATPKNKTLEMFGIPYQDGEETKRKPHHIYTMKQAIEEGFILDVLKNYTPIESYYKLTKIIADDPQFDKKKAQKKLRVYVEGQEFPIAEKAAMIVEHFHNNVAMKIGGKARAMVVTSSIKRAIEYFTIINKELESRNSQFKAIVAFSGEKEIGGKIVNENTLNKFSGKDIEDTFKEEPYRILIAADKFQTGFDEPLLHTMYVDKMLYDIAAVQTLSRLNRAHPQKNDTCVLDFANDADTIQRAFETYYKTTILSKEADPQKLNECLNTMENLQVYDDDMVNACVKLYLGEGDREQLEPLLNKARQNYFDLDIAGQIAFKSNAKTFNRTYNFLAAILPYGSPEWEKKSIFLTLLLPKLPPPKGEDLSEGILETVDLESYRLEKREAMAIKLSDDNAEIDPISTNINIFIPLPELEPLSQIIDEFHTLWGNINWTDKDKIVKQLKELPVNVAKYQAYQNAIKNSDSQNARDESDRATMNEIEKSMSTGLELYKHIMDNEGLKKWVFDMVFNNTYNKPRA
jgi:type I restriction enzyme R subunit